MPQAKVAREPVSFFVSGPEAVWVWEPGRGLIKLTAPFRERNPDGFQLSVDGTTLRYGSSGSALLPDRRFSLDLLSGVETEEPAWPSNTRVFYGDAADECRVEWADWVNHHPTQSIYRLRNAAGDQLPSPFSLPATREDEWIELPTRFTLSTSLDGDTLQFSPDGHRLVVNCTWWGHPVGAIQVFDRTAGLVHQRYGFVTEGSGVWSPNGRKLLGRTISIGRSIEYRVEVFDLERRDATPVPIDSDDYQRSEAPCVGWLDDDHVLLYTRQQRDITFHAFHTGTGERTEVNTFRLPMPSGSMNDLHIAPRVVANRPGALL